MRDSLFGLYIHHGGRIVRLDGKEVYVGGECEVSLKHDPDMFGYFDVEEIVKNLGYSSWVKLCYEIPRSQSFCVLQDDKNCMEMLSCLTPYIRVLHCYVDGGVVSISKAGENVGGSSTVAKKIDGGSKSVAKKIDDGSSSKAGDGDEGQYDSGYESDNIYQWDWGGDGEDEPNAEGGGEVNEDVENQYSDDDESEDSTYIPLGGESSDDELDDDELVADDEEYEKSRKEVKARRSIFDLVEQEPDKGMGFNLVYDHEDAESDYVTSGNEDSNSTDEELEGKRNRKFRSSYDPRTKPKKLKLQLGMRFADGFECREALRDNAIAHGKHIRFGKVTKTTCRATCTPPCKWTVFASLVEAHDYFMIKTYFPTHTCGRKSNNKLVSSKWIATKYQNVFRVQPNLPIKLLADDLRTRYKTIVGRDRLYRARTTGQEMMRGSVEGHYALLRRYVAELMRVDPEGTYRLSLGEESVFKGLYIGHSALRHGFKKSCRPIIGLDGCFLKTYLGGILLAAVGKDGNNQMFPLAWAVVEVENESCWNWFLEILLQDLGITDGNGWSFISDQQKGLMNAVSKLAPLAEHRNCARHVYMNWKKQHKGTSLKNIFWGIVKSTYEQEYKLKLEELKAENVAAYEDFVARDVKRFCKAFISLSPCSDMVDNNIARHSMAT
ncbi:uncharacterized protein LOC130993584 [Salvia miltiorrhiza]|uniref:uncharacterized protein LOC130993584 n=1 Tax=Salvia miltiorrhiza TaxID=226208 RepID=UPI0025AC09C5|nr:uncharacterized protein LOC130993584 [Salvia miltiorrhiza]